MRDVAMSRVRLFVLVRPFEQSPVAPDLHWGKAVARSFKFRAELLVNAEQPRRFVAVAEEAANDLRVHRSAHAQNSDLAVRQLVSVFGRDRRPGYKAPLF